MMALSRGLTSGDYSSMRATSKFLTQASVEGNLMLFVGMRTRSPEIKFNIVNENWSLGPILLNSVKFRYNRPEKKARMTQSYFVDDKWVLYTS